MLVFNLTFSIVLKQLYKFSIGRKEQCVRKRYYYYLNRECYSEWLDWEPCDKTCGGGTSQRYRFIVGAKSYSKQVRSCNQQACEAWSHWQPAELKCNENCTKLWTRQCVYNGSVVKAGRCLIDSFISNGNVTHQRLPCVVSNCPGFVQKGLQQDRTSLNGSDTQTNTQRPFLLAGYFLTKTKIRNQQAMDFRLSWGSCLELR